MTPELLAENEACTRCFMDGPHTLAECRRAEHIEWCDLPYCAICEDYEHEANNY